MNDLELNSVALLKTLIENNGVIGIKTSFEDEGATFDEVVRTKELCNQAGTKLFLKIAGAEAKRDLADSIIIGVKGIVAPMIESPFALDKFISSVLEIFPEDILSNVQLGINIETYQAYKNFDDICKSDSFKYLYHVTLGRNDFVSSMGKPLHYCDSEEIFDIAKDIFTKTKEANKKAYMGGGITTKSENFITNLSKKGLLDKFESRNVVYDPVLALNNLGVAINNGLKFELNLLKNRRLIYDREVKKTEKRIEVIEKRIDK